MCIRDRSLSSLRSDSGLINGYVMLCMSLTTSCARCVKLCVALPIAGNRALCALRCVRKAGNRALHIETWISTVCSDIRSLFQWRAKSAVRTNRLANMRLGRRYLFAPAGSRHQNRNFSSKNAHLMFCGCLKLRGAFEKFVAWHS